MLKINDVKKELNKFLHGFSGAGFTYSMKNHIKHSILNIMDKSGYKDVIVDVKSYKDIEIHVKVPYIPQYVSIDFKPDNIYFTNCDDITEMILKYDINKLLEDTNVS